MIPNAPGVQMQPIPDDGIAEESDDEDAKPHSSEHRISSEQWFYLILYTGICLVTISWICGQDHGLCLGSGS